MKASQIEQCAHHLNKAMNDHQTLIPLTTQYPELTIDQAYAISLAFLNIRLEKGEKVIGKKIIAPIKSGDFVKWTCIE